MKNANTPLFQATIGDLKEMFEEMFPLGENLPEDPKGCDVEKHLVYGIAGLAKLLGVCRATASKIKSSGFLDPAISQYGKVIVIDADLVLELMKAKKHVSNRRKYIQTF